MAYYDRRIQLIKTLESIKGSSYDKSKLEIIIINDASDLISDIKDIFSDLTIIICNVKNKQKTWVNCCIPYNIGFNMVKYDKVIIQNPESYHNGDILAYVDSNLTDKNYITFGCYSLSIEEFKDNNYQNIVFNNGLPEYTCESGWYNHTQYNPKYYHYCSAISYDNLCKLKGFDETYKNGIGYDDNEFLHRIRLLGLDISIVDNPFVFHQWHGSTYHFDISYPKEFIDNNKRLLNINFELYKNTLEKKTHIINNNSFFNGNNTKNTKLIMPHKDVEPNSYSDFKDDIKQYIYKKYPKDIKILDVGPGIGTYSKLLPDYKNIDCVEIYEPYVEQYSLNSHYKNVFVKDILDFDFDYYDVIIMGDIMEHLSVEDTLKLFSRILPKCDDIIVNIPYLADFNHLKVNAGEPNHFNLHIQVDLTESIMKERYPILKMMWSNDRIGIYMINRYQKKTLAITTYLDDNDIILDEFYWLYKSFIYSGNYINSDLVIFCNPSVINKIDKSVLDDKNVIIIPSEPISNIDQMWSEYKFVNSVYFVTTEDAKILLNYEYTMSTDCDVFLTKNLIDFRPHLHTFGLGHYLSDTYSRDKIENIIKKIGLKYDFIHNVGASYLSKTQSVIDFRMLEYDVCKHLMKNEFEDYGKWDGWYKGTLTMYAGEIVANQLGVANIRTNVLDSYSMSDSKISNNFYHIHAWHTEQYFSKHKFRKGEYKDIDVDKLDIDIVNNYCLFIATKSIDYIKRISNY